MDFFSSMRVSATGLDAQMQRMNTISSNIANAETPGYKRKDAVLSPNADREHFAEILNNRMDEDVQGVLVSEIREDERAPRMVYNPTHPQANADGYVEMPNVNSVQEMANMISAQRAYEANLQAVSAAKNMALKALEISK